MTAALPKKRCFVARPVSLRQEHQERYREDREHWQHVHDHLIVPAVEAAGYVPVAPTSRGSNLIHADIVRNLNDCELVLADLSTLNPNVLFEAGIRTSINKPLVLIAEHGTELPFDVSGINTSFYDPELVPWTLSSAVAALTSHIQETDLKGNSLWRGFGISLQSAELKSSASPEDARLEVLTAQTADIQRTLDRLQLGRSRPREALALDLEAEELRLNRQQHAQDLLEAAANGVIELHVNERRVLENLAAGRSLLEAANLLNMTGKVALMHLISPERRVKDATGRTSGGLGSIGPGPSQPRR